MNTDTPPNISRQEWMKVLAHAPGKELEAVCLRLAPLPAYQLVRGPETGMIMVQARAGGVGKPFNMGETTVTRCSLQIDQGAMGTAYVLGRNRRHAELAALLDALLQDAERQPDLLATVILPLAAAIRNRRENQAGKTAATKVEFFTMVRGD